MKNLPPIILILIVALTLSAVAILSVQNATLVTINFFTFQSIGMPIGVILAFFASLGAIITVILPTLFSRE